MLLLLWQFMTLWWWSTWPIKKISKNVFHCSLCYRYIHTKTYTQTYIHTYTQTYMHTYIHTYIRGDHHCNNCLPFCRPAMYGTAYRLFFNSFGNTHMVQSGNEINYLSKQPDQILCSPKSWLDYLFTKEKKIYWSLPTVVERSTKAFSPRLFL